MELGHFQNKRLLWKIDFRDIKYHIKKSSSLALKMVLTMGIQNLY